MSDIPDGAEHDVAAMAIAWAMVQKTNVATYGHPTPEEILQKQLESYIKAYKIVSTGKLESGK